MDAALILFATGCSTPPPAPAPTPVVAPARSPWEGPPVDPDAPVEITLSPMDLGRVASAAGLSLVGNPVLDVAVGSTPTGADRAVVVVEEGSGFRVELTQSTDYATVEAAVRASAAEREGWKLIRDEPRVLVVEKTDGGTTTWGVYVDVGTRGDALLCMNATVVTHELVAPTASSCESFRYYEIPPTE
ncbi:MAG: hypothetical protein H6736_24155 [Alphaproteobacteria bacterium]|nr:hypothetical protein [Alphaproteobacteria bacterium]